MTFADKVIQFNTSLDLTKRLPRSIGVLNPFVENKNALTVSSEFYKKYYDDNRTRKLILGINPGRHGAGITGIPFTDTKRLEAFCDLTIPEVSTHEISSVFVYEFIEKYGGAKQFYQDYYINSISPLGFVIKDKKGNKKTSPRSRSPILPLLPLCTNPCPEIVLLLHLCSPPLHSSSAPLLLCTPPLHSSSALIHCTPPLRCSSSTSWSPSSSRAGT